MLVEILDIEVGLVVYGGVGCRGIGREERDAQMDGF